MNDVFINLGFIKIYWYSIMTLIALLVGGFMVIKESKKWNINEDFLINMFFYLIPISYLGARIYYVAFNFDYYKYNIVEIFKIWEGGLAIHGGLIFGLLFIIFYCRKYKVRTWRILDMSVVGLLIAQAIGRWGNFFNQEAYGFQTTLIQLKELCIPNFIIEGMQINGVYYHPTFFYESLWCLLGFIIFLFIRKYKYLKLGQLTGLYMVWYGIGRFFIEKMRVDSLMFGDFKMAQIVSIVMVVVGIVLYFVKNKGSKLENLYNDYEVIEDVKF